MDAVGHRPRWHHGLHKLCWALNVPAAAMLPTPVASNGAATGPQQQAPAALRGCTSYAGHSPMPKPSLGFQLHHLIVMGVLRSTANTALEVLSARVVRVKLCNLLPGAAVAQKAHGREALSPAQACILP